jgi:hypothetical protein
MRIRDRRGFPVFFPPRRRRAVVPAPSDEFTARCRRVEAALPRLGDGALAVDEMLSAARWLDSFARGEDNYAGLGPAAAEWLAGGAAEVLDAAGALAAGLARARALAAGDGAR